MQVIVETRPHEPTQLYNEIVAAIPSLAAVDAPSPLPSIPGTVKVAQVLVNTNGNIVTVYVPDSANANAVRNIIQAHVKQPNPVIVAEQKEVTDRVALTTLIDTLLPPTYGLTELANDLTSLKAYYQADAAPSLANLKTNLRTSLRVNAFMVRWIARNSPR